MSELDNIKKVLREALIENRVRRYHEDMDNIHVIEEQGEKTVRSKPGDDQDTKTPTNSDDVATNIIDQGRRPIKSDDDNVSSDSRATKSSKYVQGGNITPAGSGALKMHTIWNNNLTQIMNFSKGKQLSAKIAKRLQNQTGLPIAQMLPIVTAVMKAVLEQLDDEVSDEIEQELPGVLDAVRS